MATGTRLARSDKVMAWPWPARRSGDPASGASPSGRLGRVVSCRSAAIGLDGSPRGRRGRARRARLTRLAGSRVAASLSSTGPVRKRRTSAGGRVAGQHWLLPSAPARPCSATLVPMSVPIHSTPRASKARPSGQAKTSPLMLPCASGRSLAGSPASTRWFQRKRSPSKSPSSFQRMIWPMALLARGLAASGAGLAAGCRARCCWSACSRPSRLAGRWPATRGGPSWCAPSSVAGLARLDHHLALVGKAVGRGQRPLAVHQRQPAAAAVGVEARHVQRAVVQQLGVGLRGVRPPPAGAMRSRLTNL